MGVLIDNGHIKFEDGAFDKINAFDDSLLISLIEVMYSDFQNKLECKNLTFDEDELRILLSSSNLSQTQKHDAINRASADINPTQQLFDNIEKFASYPKSKFAKYIADTSIIQIPQQLTDKLLKSKISVEKRVLLFIGQIHFFENEEIKKSLSNLGFPYSSLSTSGSYSNIEDTRFNLLLAQALEHHKIIKSWSKKSFIFESDKIRMNMYRK